MSDEKNTDGISLELKADGAAARASDQALSKLGKVATWLMPRRDAKVRITTALADRVAEKIKAGTPLDGAEQFFVGQFFEKEARLLGNREAAAEEIQRVLPEVSDRLKELPPAPEATPSQSFINRAEAIASEVSEDEIRELFARLVAGEVCRPGSISLRTLETVRSLDARTARAFDAFCRFVINGNVVVKEKKVRKFLDGRGVNDEMLIELQDAGLIRSDSTWALQKGVQILAQYGERLLRITIEQDGMLGGISLHRLTRIGQELAAVLPFNPDNDYFDTVCTSIAAKVGDLGIVQQAMSGAKEWTRVGTTKAG